MDDGRKIKMWYEDPITFGIIILLALLGFFIFYEAYKEMSR